MSTDTATIESFFVKSLRELGVDADEIAPETTFEALDVDSLDLAELGQMVEEEFGIKITGGDVAALKSVGDAIALVQERTA